MKKYIGLFLVTIFCSLSCEREIILDIEIPKKLVVLGSITPGLESNIRVSTSTTNSENPILTPKTAKLNLKENGVSVGEYEYYESIDSYYMPESYYRMNYDFKEGAQYEISVELDGLETAFSSTTIPSNTLSDLVGVMDTPIIDNIIHDGFKQYSAQVSFDKEFLDDDGLYHVKTYIQSVNSYYIEDTILTSTPSFIGENIRSKFLTHEEGFLFRGQDLSTVDKFGLQVIFFFNEEFEEKGDIVVEIRQVSKEYFDFHSTVAEQEISNVNAGILTQNSTPIVSNIENGFGFFGSYTSKLIEFDW